MDNTQIKNLLNNQKFQIQLRKLVKHSELNISFNAVEDHTKQKQLKELVQKQVKETNTRKLENRDVIKNTFVNELMNFKNHSFKNHFFVNNGDVQYFTNYFKNLPCIMNDETLLQQPFFNELIDYTEKNLNEMNITFMVYADARFELHVPGHYTKDYYAKFIEQFKDHDFVKYPQLTLYICKMHPAISYGGYNLRRMFKEIYINIITDAGLQVEVVDIDTLDVALPDSMK